MAGINQFNDYNNTYNQNQNNSYFLSGLTNRQTSASGLDLTDYAAIRNGSYKKLMKAYYKNQEEEKTSTTSKTQDTKQSLTAMRDKADSLKKSTAALMDSSLWEKKKIKKKDEKTGEETEVEDYDWEAITKAVKSFVSDYNDVIEAAGKSDTRIILRNAVRMTSTTQQLSGLLEEVGISIGKDNKLAVDEEKLKEARVTTLKTLFTGAHSFGDKVAQKANSISKATVQSKSTYTRNGSYSDTLSKLVSGKVDEEA